MRQKRRRVAKLVTLVSFTLQIIYHLSDVEKCTYLKTNGKCLNFKFKFNPVDEDWKRNKCESLGFTFIQHKKFQSVLCQNYDTEELYKVFSELICGDSKYLKKLQKNICLSIKTNDDIKNLFADEESFNDYLNHHIIFENPVSPYEKDGTEECPICLKNDQLSVLLNKCLHSLCNNCADILVGRNEKKCPLCRTRFSHYIDEVEGNVISKCSLIEYVAVAHYLDVCIFLCIRKGEWVYFDKNGPNYSKKHMDGKKCIYLFYNEHEKTIGVVVDTEDYLSLKRL
ncbi:uncharacterized protein LOC126895028 isoform X5 [Daktulosphaira vitifoliae]|uniref:uncharacterized protein LOC126895028 isoform X4 n=1 Tax=Daktulosphaira vitifoliae TaxID=58002 RepID=UPI0021AA7F60|nr:uncharacterized protein LOC126895028 isoform X4 [Daktulosphaira vitifoliae]XP_050522435.1 uncharacterized protein LOC126895028 isoform X5 [Daktulosphaira vitifoliae]